MDAPTIVWSPAYEVDIGAHVFPTRKYRLVRERLLSGGGWREADFAEAQPATPEMLARVHTAEYLRKIREDDFGHAERVLLEVPFSPALRTAAVLCCGGTTMAGRLALRDRVAVHLGGGFHHAFADHGEGFCLLNDVAVAAAQLLAEGSVERVLVVDLDVHQGNGTAAIFADEPRVFTLSMHQEHNYPARKPPSDLDLGLADGTSDGSYLAALREHLPRVLERHRPDLVLYLAGADPYREDQLGGLGLSLDGLRLRDEAVLADSLAAGAAVAVALAGGYAFRVTDTVAIHAATVEAARRAIQGVGGARPGR
jgi:acetoin utilization deacetylase AcuC-like enzyme